MHRTAKIGLGVNVHDALLHKRLHGASRRAGKLAHFTGRRAADRAQQLQNGDLMRRTPAAADLLLRLFQRDGEAGILQLLVAHDALLRALHGQKFLLHEPVQRACRVFVAKRRLQLVERPPCSSTVSSASRRCLDLPHWASAAAASSSGAAQ